MTAARTPSLTPAETAERTGFSLDTLRYYERIGLLAGVRRAPSGHRRFTEQDLEWLGILRCLRDTGMPIADMRRYAELARSGDAGCAADRLALLQEHDAAVEAQIALLNAQREHLREKIRHYRTALSADAGQ